MVHVNCWHLEYLILLAKKGKQMRKEKALKDKLEQEKIVQKEKIDQLEKQLLTKPVTTVVIQPYSHTLYSDLTTGTQTSIFTTAFSGFSNSYQSVAAIQQQNVRYKQRSHKPMDNKQQQQHRQQRQLIPNVKEDSQKVGLTFFTKHETQAKN
jgi:hypothetical protein